MSQHSPVTQLKKKTMGFMVGAAVALLLLVLLVAVKQDFFSQTTSLYFFSDNAQSLNKGMSVKFIGFKVGHIENISMEANATVKVELSVSNEYLHFIGRDAKVKLRKEGMLGENIIEIIRGDPNTRQVAQNDVLSFEREQDIAELAVHLVEQIQPILSDVKQITASVSRADQDIQQAVKNINLATSQLLSITQHVNALSQKGEASLAVAHHTLQSIDQALPSLVYKVDNSLATTQHALSLLDHALPSLLQNAESSLANIHAVSSDLQKMSSAAVPQVPKMMRHGSVLMQDSQEIISGAKKSWPIRNLITPPEAVILPLDGYALPITP